eukprot:c26422_g2_i3 orf=221-388(+)
MKEVNIHLYKLSFHLFVVKSEIRNYFCVMHYSFQAVNPNTPFLHQTDVQVRDDHA